MSDEDVKSRVDEELLRRGVLLRDYEKGRITQDAFFAQEVPLTIREHVNQMNEQGSSKEEIDLDMVNRGFYNVQKDVGNNLDEILPPTLETERHKNVMEGWAPLGITLKENWADRYKSGGFEGHDPWSIPELMKSKRRVTAIQSGLDTTLTDETMKYMEWLGVKDVNSQLTESQWFPGLKPA